LDQYFLRESACSVGKRNWFPFRVGYCGNLALSRLTGGGVTRDGVDKAEVGLRGTPASAHGSILAYQTPRAHQKKREAPDMAEKFFGKCFPKPSPTDAGSIPIHLSKLFSSLRLLPSIGCTF